MIKKKKWNINANKLKRLAIMNPLIILLNLSLQKMENNRQNIHY